jgi:FHA domain
MGILQNKTTKFELPCRCLVGRSSLADIVLSSRRASSEHASIGWQAGRWTLRDLGSSNGTTANGRPLLTRDRALLSPGAALCFGGDDELWLFADASPPEPCAVLLGPQKCHFGNQSLLVVPSEEEPEASIFLEGERWLVDDGSEMISPECGDIVRLRSGFWRLLLPDYWGADAMTAGRELELTNTELCFQVSQERVLLSITQGSSRVQLPSRACVYTLLALARLRMNSSAPDSEAGWVSSAELAEMRACSVEKVNVDIHRLRRLFQEAGVHQAAKIVERDDAKRLRIGVKQIREFRQP